MAAVIQPCPLISLFFVSLFSILHLSSCQPNSPRNIETFYPFRPPPNPTNPIPNPRISQLSIPSSKSSSSYAVAKAVAVTAATTIVVSGLFFILFQKYTVARGRSQKGKNDPRGGGENVVSHIEFSRFNGNLNGLIVDENGLDVLYWKKLEGDYRKNSFPKQALHNLKHEEKRMSRNGDGRAKSEPIQEIPLLRGKSSTSYDEVQEEVENLNWFSAPPPSSQSSEISLEAVGKTESTIQSSTSLPPPPPILAIPQKPSATPPPSPPIPAKINPIPPPPPSPSPPIPAKINPIPPPPPSPPIPAKINPIPPPPPSPKAGGFTSSSKEASSVTKGMPNGSKLGESSSGYSKAGTGNGRVALKPLHWDKVNTNADHSMVWHKINGGSFSFDGDLMDALFGNVAANGRSPQINHNNPNGASSIQSAQIFILDSRKSQNTAIVLRSLAISRKEILNALIKGQDLNADALEKLTKIAPTKEEESQILAFEGDPTRLADAESFLYHILKAVPSAFIRLSAMFFRSNYDSEILHLRECLQTLELGCKELRTRGLFLKLLEAILEAGNRMNAGTSRGNAQAFNLAALQKLSDVKSTDGKTTLLHFVVEEVVRSEGKRCVLNRNRSLSHSSNSSLYSENSASREDREKEYIMIGLPVVGSLSAEFSNVKKVAEMDYNAFGGVCSTLTAHSTEIKQFVAPFANSDGGFLRKMKSFLEAAGEELREVREEQTRVMELLRRTTEYYQPRSSKNKEASPLQLFIIVKDFLGMVDQVCVDIARNLQRRKTTTASLGPSSTKSPPSRIPVKFPNLPPNFMPDKSRNSSSSDSEDEF
ncbi:formin-like protein 4 [Vitis vinifera]|uniref:Formin-like protein n=1 Tax=Vitis vinifera TaxID=29760 RepID=F6H5Q3_VITVI|nr:formin-like protein 4 [Vitis vinifera]|eukprot:XP_002277455.1 PREDICTED: formin-like protein 4 [Vitis vinifera]